MDHIGFNRAFIGARPGVMSAAVGALLGIMAVFAAPPVVVQAHEGHDHGQPENVTSTTAPRMSAHSDAYELVGILRGERLVIYLDRFATNEPVTNANVAVTVADEAVAIVADATAAGAYAITSPRFRSAGAIELVFAITDGADEDLLIGQLTVPREVAASASGGSTIDAFQRWLSSLVMSWWQMLLLMVATAVLAVYGGYLLLKRNVVQGAVTALIAVAGLGVLLQAARGHGDDNDPRSGATPQVVSVDSPRRLPDGHIFVPKPTQRLLEVRTETLAPQSAQRAVNLIGRVIADPNRTSLVQSINGGRVMAPESGLPRIGQTVKKGDILAHIEPALPQADRTTILEKLGEVEQMISVAEARLRRTRILVEKQVAPQSQLVDAEIELDGLRRRRQVLLEIRVEPEVLRAQTSGVIAAARVVPGQVVQAQDVLFQIVDPRSLWVEALVYGEIDPATLGQATATTPGRPPLTLRLQGFSHALQQHASVVQFSIENPPNNLSVGLPVSVIAQNGEPVNAIIVPKDAIVRSANGEAIVWRHEAAEVFEPRPVRVTPFDASRMAIADGVEKGDRVVVRGSDLVNQVR